jgi:glycine cleavage system transcriptional repressor
MAKLGGEFAVLVLVTGSLQALSRLSSMKAEIEERLRVSCFFKDTSQPESAGDGLFYQLEVSGFDRPGIVRTVSEVLSAHGVNVASLSSKVVHAPLTGTPMFVLDADLSIPTTVAISTLRQALTLACDRENLDYSLDLGRG